MVLIVDDDADIRRLLLMVAKMAEVDGHAVDCGEAALAWLDSHQPRLIILDLNMPDLIGTEVLKRIRANPATQDLPVVLHTAVHDQSIVKGATELGANGALLKGRYELGDVIRVMQTYCKAASCPDARCRPAA